MTIPDRIERVRIFPVSRERVWSALTRSEQLSQWFGTKIQVDLRVGGEVRFDWGYAEALPAVIEVVDPPQRFAFRWHAVAVAANLPPSVARTLATRVEFTLEEVAEGTRLTLVESGFASLPEALRESAFKGNLAGWDQELAYLARYLQSEDPACQLQK